MNKIFESIIAPIPTESFFQDYYEKKPLYIPRSNSDYYESYFSRNSIFKFLKGDNIIYPKIRLWNGGVETPPQAFTKPMGGKGYPQNVPVVDQAKLSHLFLEEKHSLLINSAQDCIPDIEGFCTDLSKTLFAFVQANIYNTPKNSFCFGHHADKHDVMILQLSGCKQWQIFDQPYYLPYNNENTDDLDERRAAADCLLDIELKAGDFLYIPRGFIHEVHSHSLHSMHATIGIFPLKWRDVLYRIIEEDGDKSMLKESVPFCPNRQANLSQSKLQFEEHIRSLINSKLDNILLKKMADFKNNQEINPEEHKIEHAFRSQILPEDTSSSTANNTTNDIRPIIT